MSSAAGTPGTSWLGATGCSVSGPGVVEFLLQDAAFPRSVRHCTMQVDRILDELPDRHDVRDALASLDDVTGPPSASSDPEVLHVHVADLQRSLAQVHLSVTDAYFASSSPQPVPHATSDT